MAMTPLAVMILSMPVTALVTLIVVKARPELSRRRIIAVAVAPISCLFLIYLFGNGAFRGSPDDWEGLTHVFAPFAGTFILGLQILLAGAASALVLSLARPPRGDPE
jgi:hypothetical protein